MGELAGEAQTAAQWIPARAPVPAPPVDENAATGIFPPADADLTQLPGIPTDDSGATVLPPPPDSDATRYEPPAPRRPSTSARPSGAGSSLSATARPLSGGAEGPLKSGQAFGSRYHIIKVLGVGGMGAVYQAFDAELGVSVAVKVIRPEITADPDAAQDIERRFKRELLLAREVTHKNVVRIHDLGEIDGIKYITMAFINGSDLATLLKKDQKLPVPRALHIARGIVSGLVSAHDAGVVHRDLKPANIMVSGEDEPTIMDFGIARSSSRGGKVAGPAVKIGTAQLRRTDLLEGGTMAGAIVGTVEYMAPEQAKGQEVDQRADVYAFGLILYDMLIGGRRSERAASAIAELQGRIEHAPPRPRTVDPTIPVAVDEIVARCLEPDPAKRFQTTLELQAALARLDDNGKPLPIIRRLTKKGMAAAAGLVVLLLAGTFYTATWLMTPEKPHDPVSVVVADFQNGTQDTALQGALEQTMRRALEGASFISAYDRSRVRTSFGVQPPAQWDEAAARELAVKQGLGVVLAGAIEPRGTGYEISVRVLQAVTGEVISTARQRASGKDDVLEAATRLMANVRKVLGDRTSTSDQLFAMRSVSTSSLEVVQHYAAGMQAQSNGNYEEALKNFSRAVELDPEFGLAYQGLASTSRNLGRLQDAEKYTNETLKHLGGVTDRERLTIRGFYYAMAGDYQQCVKEYSEVAVQYAGDPTAHNNRALCLSRLRNMTEAVAGMREAIRALPMSARYRGNLALYANYAGDFQTAENEANGAPEATDLTTIAVAFAQLGQGRLPEAIATYEKLRTLTARGASWSASGLGDLALYQGRWAGAARLFELGAEADLAAKNPDRAARKLTSLAQVQLLRGEQRAAIATAEKALATSKALPIRFLAARIFTEANALDKARELAKPLTAELAAEPQAYGKIIEGEIALKRGDARGAIKILTDANSILDTWLGHFALGRAYVAAEAYLQADSEFDRCVKRRGEALSLLLDEEPTYGYLPVVYYYQGLVREALKNAGSAESYGEYLKIRGESTEDPLVPEIKKRLAGS